MSDTPKPILADPVKCTSCGARVFYARTEAGKTCPYDPEPVKADKGQKIYCYAADAALNVMRRVAEGEMGHRSHTSQTRRASQPAGRPVVSPWATPQERDWKDTGPAQGNRKSPNLGTQTHAASHTTSGSIPTEIPCRPRSTNGNPPGCIHAEWRASLMGFPPGWLRLSTSAASRLQETLKARSASKPSPAE